MDEVKNSIFEMLRNDFKGSCNLAMIMDEYMRLRDLIYGSNT